MPPQTTDKVEQILPTSETLVHPIGPPNEQSNEKNVAQKSQSVQRTPDSPPNGGYGWVNVVCVFLINGHTWGLNSTYGVFLAYYLSHSVFEGATHLDFAFVGGLSISVALFVCPIGTLITRRFGTHATLALGVFFETTSMIGASFAKSIWQLFLSQGVCFGLGMGFLFVGQVGIIPQWFTTRRSLANGIGAAGSGFGGLTYSLAANAMISRIGLGWTFRVLGIVACIVNSACSALIRDRNKQVGSSHNPIDLKLLKRPEYLLLLAFGFLSMLGYVVLLFSLPNYADSIGLTAQQGSVLGAVLNLGQGLGRPPIGYFSDAMGRLNMGATMTFFAGLFSLVIWINATSYGVLIFFSLIGGAVAGTYWAVIAPIATEVLGLVDLPSGLSLNWLVLSIPTTFAEAIGLGITAANNGDYLGAQLFCGWMYIGAAWCLWLVRAWKIDQLEQEAAAKESNQLGQGDTSSVEQDRTKVARYLRNLVKVQKV